RSTDTDSPRRRSWPMWCPSPAGCPTTTAGRWRLRSCSRSTSRTGCAPPVWRGRCWPWWALLGPHGLPLELIPAAATAAYLTAFRRAGAGMEPIDAMRTREALMCLARLNLVDVVTDDDGGGQRVRMHGLVQRATRDQSPRNLIDDAALAAFDALAEVWPPVER